MTNFSRYLMFKLFLTVSIITVLYDCAIADSLWQKRVSVNYNLFDDNRARRIGDLVTITISEKTTIDNSEESTTDNTSTVTGSRDNDKFFRGMWSGIRNGRNARFDDRTANAFSNAYSDDFDGKGTYDSSRIVKDITMTAMVVEVLDNGNLVLEGKRNVKVNKEQYTLKLTGIARPIDISTDNIIASEKMSNVKFGLDGKGWLTRAGKKGWFNRLKDLFWPY
ncbi:MAG: Flagellar L-ring protein [Candidatus Scalindua arabica]|uniref:Flagellar L-ring protein n=1 Tax=Candidatus Scalindua arabica TaxID=1127984 RepID=A0A941W622_9BACT|nr:Flagellar L-ring protein [Candidatus Scalindua arabica]